MAKIKASELCASFEEIQGWPYVSPGSNSEKGIDCSGAFVRAYSKAGKSIYHGSNRIIRKHCHGVKKIASIADLQPGMPVFKARTDLSKLPAEYKPGGANYIASLLFDFYHIGLCVSTSPQRIIHATTPKAKEDSTIGTWAWTGYLDEVEYTEAAQEAVEAPVTACTAIVSADNGKPVRIRKAPSAASVWLDWLAVGTQVQVLESGPEWCRVKAGSKVGYVMAKYLKG